MKRDLKDLLPICGIYTITNKITGRTYVGQSKNIISRWVQHTEDLENNTHSNKDLQQDWNKFGAGSFVAQVIQRCKPEYLLKEESYCIREYRALAGVYNLGNSINFKE